MKTASALTLLFTVGIAIQRTRKRTTDSRTIRIAGLGRYATQASVVRNRFKPTGVWGQTEKMSSEQKEKKAPLRPFRIRFWRKARWPLVWFGLVPLSLVSFAIAIQSATFTNTATPQSNGSPHFAVNAATTPPTVLNFTSTTVCSAGSGSYVNGGNPLPSINWGSVLAGNSYNVFICLENSGTGIYIIPPSSLLNATAMNGCTTPPCGSLIVPQGGSSVPASGFLLVQIQWQVRSTIPTGGTTNFPLTLS